MANIKQLNTSIDKFILNEKRVEKYLNDEFGYVADDGTYVPSLREIQRKIESGEIGSATAPHILKIYQTYAEALGDIENRLNMSYSRVLFDETRDSRDSIYIIVNGALQFVKYEDIPDAIDSGTY
jgi:hypothetical protein